MLALVAVLVASSYALVSPSMQEHLQTAQAGQKLPVQIVLKEQFDKALLNSLVEGMPKVQRRLEVVRILSEFSAEKQAGVLAYLAGQPGSVENVKSFWVLNAVYCEATPAVIQALSLRPEVNYVNYDLVYQPNLLEEATPVQSTDEITWGVDKVNAPDVWALGYTGAGVVCGHIDTGCNYNHPDLADHMWTDANYPHHGWNFENNNNDPMDISGHGTHTSGTVAGDGTGGSQTGVAPDAQIMVCRVRTQVDSTAESQCWAAMEFCVAPPLSPSNGADLYTMSLGWQISWSPHQASWRTTADNVNAAGVSQIVAAGNERGIAVPDACRCPGNVPPPWWNPENTGEGALSGVVSIGATDSTDAIASFSSNGPVTWSSVAPFNDYPYPPGLTRPDVSAPGVDVKSCSYSGSGYSVMSGTSMATPHTAGVVCLMLSKNPELTPAEVDSLLEVTSIDLGPAGKDNDFGAGRIDALAVVEATPFPGPRHDIGIGDILAPTDSVFPEYPLAPRVIVKNRGDYVENGVLVWCKAESAGTKVYGDTIRIPVMDTLAVDTLTFVAWNTGPGGANYNVTFWHSYVPDTVPQNDTARIAVLTLGHDIALAGMNIDSQVRSNRPVTPIANVKNVGGYVETGFTAYCRVDSGAVAIYRESVSVDTVGLGATKNVNFPAWQVGGDSTVYTVRMWHDCGPDQHRVNDTLVRRTTSTIGAIRVAIEIADSSRGRTPPNACYMIDSMCRGQGWFSEIVSGADLDEWAELMNFDVVVTGDDGYGHNDFASYDNVLHRWVKSGGGYVGLGWLVLGTYMGPGRWSPMDSVNAVMARDNYGFQSSGMIHVLDSAHPVTHEVADFSIYDYGEYSVAGPWPGATMLAEYTDSPGKAAVAVNQLGDGRSVYLGPIYFADFQSHNNQAYYTDHAAVKLLRQSIVWAASGPGAGVGSGSAGPVRVAHLSSAFPSPFRYSTVINYSLPLPAQVKLAVYDLAGKMVKTLVSGIQPAGVRQVTWNRSDDAGRRVAQGVYFCRFEADGVQSSRKVVVR